MDVRLIYDGFGCLTTLPHKYYEELREKGNLPVRYLIRSVHLLNIIQNNRDHRKLCIIDGWVGFTGGINLADEYINQKERFGHWKDTAVMLKGEAVWNMTAMFLHMWAVVSTIQMRVLIMKLIFLIDIMRKSLRVMDLFSHSVILRWMRRL